MAEYRYITEQGLIVPDTSQTRAELEAEIKGLFGNDIDLDARTPQGVLITAATMLLDSIVRNNAELANQINTTQSTGIFLDALASLNRIQRQEPVRGIVNAILLGTPGITIPAGSKAKTIQGDIYELEDDVTLVGQQFTFPPPAPQVLNWTGVGEGVFISSNEDALPISPYGLSTIVDAVVGWDGVFNPFASGGSIDGEQDWQLKKRRNDALAMGASSTREAVASRVAGVLAFRSMCVLENDSSSQQTIRGISLGPNALWVCVQGGRDLDIALAINASKGAGTPTQGNTMVNIPDPYLPAGYDIYFQRPRAVVVTVKVTVTGSIIDLEPTIKRIVQDYAAGRTPGDSAFRVGVDISPWEIAGAINQDSPEINVRKVELSINQGGWSSDVATVDADEVGVLNGTEVVIA